MFKGQLPMCPGKQLRVPQAPDMRSNRDFLHEGVVVVRTGEDKGDTARLRTMYLYSPTIRFRSGKLVCSQDWRDYKLGEWIRFTVDDQERFFSNTKIEDKYPTRPCPNDMATVQVQVRYFLCPDFISNTRCNGYSKVWSPEVGPAFIRTEYTGGDAFRMAPNALYRGWLSWGVNQVNFCPHDVDEQDWPYEREALWEVSMDYKDLEKREKLSDEDYQKEVTVFRAAAEQETREELERREQEKRALSGRNCIEEDVSRDMIVPLVGGRTGTDGYKSVNSSKQLNLKIGNQSFMENSEDARMIRGFKDFGDQPDGRPFLGPTKDNHSARWGANPTKSTSRQAEQEDDMIMVRNESSINVGGFGRPPAPSFAVQSGDEHITVRGRGSTVWPNLSQRPENVSSPLSHSNGYSAFATRVSPLSLKANNVQDSCYEKSKGQDSPMKSKCVIADVINAGNENVVRKNTIPPVTQLGANTEEPKQKKAFSFLRRK